MRWNGVKNRRLYVVWYTTGDPHDPASWKLLLQLSKHYHTAEHLTSDVVHFFRVSALGALGEGPMSDVASAKPA